MSNKGDCINLCSAFFKVKSGKTRRPPGRTAPGRRRKGGVDVELLNPGLDKRCHGRLQGPYCVERLRTTARVIWQSYRLRQLRHR